MAQPPPLPFLSAPLRLAGLRHLALRVDDPAAAAHGVAAEPVRVDPFTGCPFTFIAGPDGLPMELVGPQPG